MDPNKLTASLTIKQVLVYELGASWWASWVPFIWMQELTSTYFVWKVRRKWGRFVKMCEMCERTPKR